MVTKLAPITIFVFSRPEHTRRTLAALASNTLATRSDLIVYADAARNEREAEKVNAVREIVHSASGFRSVTVVEREANYGLARNIIEGVSEVCNRYGRVIVLEDDIVTSPEFLSFMNAALNYYENNQRVWHISGWNYPIESDGLNDAFFWRVMNCWGWATWADRWKHFQKDPIRLVESWDSESINRFNLDGVYDFWRQVLDNLDGKINTWAVFWYATIFERDGLCLNASRSFVHNIGNDGTGLNCGDYDPFIIKQMGESYDDLPNACDESLIALDSIKFFYRSLRPSLLMRVASPLVRVARKFRKIASGVWASH